MSHISRKLKQARKASGLSIRAVIEQMPSSLKFTSGTLSNYENARSSPPIQTLTYLSQLYQRDLNWFLSPSNELKGIRYRNRKSKVKSHQSNKFESEAERWHDLYQKIENLKENIIPLRQVSLHFSNYAEYSKLSASEAAKLVRTKLGIGHSNPIPSVVDIAHHLGIYVIELSTDAAIDGLAAMMGQNYIVVLNHNVASDRKRFNLAHEIAHVIFGDCNEDGHISEEQEQKAHDFASHLLIPQVILEEALEGYSLLKLIRYKEKFGVSIAAMVYRSDLTEKQKKQFWIEFSKRGWRKKEPVIAPSDNASRLEEIIEALVTSDKFTWHTLSLKLGIRESELRNRLLLFSQHHHEQIQKGGPETEGHGLKLTY